MFVNSINFETL